MYSNGFAAYISILCSLSLYPFFHRFANYLFTVFFAFCLRHLLSIRCLFL